MTTYNKATLKTFFETGDVPAGGDYANFIDSYVNLVETALQTMAGPLNPTELISARVSATNGIFTGTMRIDGLMSAAAANFSGNVSAAAIYASTLNLTGNMGVAIVSAASVNVTGDVSASTGTVYASAVRTINGVLEGTGIVSAAGIAQGTAAALTFVINRGKGVVDGSTTGFAIPANRIGLTQIIVNDAVSANLWPPTGGVINALGANAAFAMAANIPYAIYHITASAYAVK